jgi:hypothetical protein
VRPQFTSAPVQQQAAAHQQQQTRPDPPAAPAAAQAAAQAPARAAAPAQPAFAQPAQRPGPAAMRELAKSDSGLSRVQQRIQQLSAAQAAEPAAAPRSAAAAAAGAAPDSWQVGPSDADAIAQVAVVAKRPTRQRPLNPLVPETQVSSAAGQPRSSPPALACRWAGASSTPPSHALQPLGCRRCRSGPATGSSPAPRARSWPPSTCC